jgi:membrane-associated phospholipid phosphatase
VFYVLIVPGISLVAATIYLRHHYVVDIAAGFALAIVCFYLAPCGCAWWERHAAAQTTPGSPSGSSLAGSQ